MAKTKRTIRPIEKNISIPENIVAEVNLHLYSELEKKIPFAAWSKLVSSLLRQWLEEKKRKEPKLTIQLRDFFWEGGMEINCFEHNNPLYIEEMKIQDNRLKILVEACWECRKETEEEYSE